MLKVTWHSCLTGEVEEALDHLPECEACPHDLYRTLLNLPRRESVSIAVVREDGQAIGAIGTVSRSRLVADGLTNWLYPGTAFPVVRSRRLSALKALGRELHLSWWRMGEPVPDDPAVGDVDIKPTYRMEDIARREEFWRSSDLRRNVKNIRNRTARMRIEVGNLAHVEPIVAGWHGKWTGGERDDFIVRARVAIAHALESEGSHVTVALLDGDEIAAGSTNFVHGGEMVAGVSYVSDKYPWISAFGIGVTPVAGPAPASFGKGGRANFAQAAHFAGRDCPGAGHPDSGDVRTGRAGCRGPKSSGMPDNAPRTSSRAAGRSRRRGRPDTSTPA